MSYLVNCASWSCLIALFVHWRNTPMWSYFNEMTSPLFIWIILTCGGLPQLVKPSFLLGNHLWKFYSIPEVLDSMPLFLLLQQRNEQLIILLKLTRGDPSSLPHESLPWSNFGQFLQGTLPLHIFLMFHRMGDELPNPTGTCYFDACQVVATQLAT